MEDVSILKSIIDEYSLAEIEPNMYSPLSLAFIGDSVYGLVVKSVITMRANCSANELNRKTTEYVKAVSQSKIVDELLEGNLLTEEEVMIYKRGRNAKSPSTAKNASVGDYRKATGLEALVGYLYLKGRTRRLIEIMKIGMELLEK